MTNLTTQLNANIERMVTKESKYQVGNNKALILQIKQIEVFLIFQDLMNVKIANLTVQWKEKDNENKLQEKKNKVESTVV